MFWRNTRRNRTSTACASDKQEKPLSGPAFHAYAANHLVHTDAGIIVDVEATPARHTLEVQSTKTMIKRLEERVALKTECLIADTAYGTAEILAWMVEEKGIEPHVPAWEKGEGKDETFSCSDFQFDAERDRYTCLNGKHLLRYRRPGSQYRARVG